MSVVDTNFYYRVKINILTNSPAAACMQHNNDSLIIRILRVLRISSLVWSEGKERFDMAIGSLIIGCSSRKADIGSRGTFVKIVKILRLNI